MSPNENLKIFLDEVMPENKARMYSPLTLAFLGDAVYSLLVRQMLSFEENKPTGKLHKQSIKYVNAAFQAQMIRELLPLLSENEEAVFKRGRNAHSSHSPKNQDAADYRYATGLEALYGYLYLCGETARINELFRLSTYKYHTEKID
jgi:ribonuclease-3 family protein